MKIERIRYFLRKYRYIFYLTPCVLFLLSLSIFPLIYSFSLSLRQWNIAYPYLGKRFVGIENYITVFQDFRFWNSVKNTLILVFLAVTIEFILGFMMALCLSKKIAGQSIIRTLFLIPLMLVPVVVGMVWKMLYHPSYGVINYLLSEVSFARINWLSDKSVALYSIIITDIWEWTPLMFLILLSGILSLPEDPFEAAEIDGASKTQLFLYITLPLLKSIIAVALLIRVIDAFKLFDIIWVLTQGGPGISTETLSYYTYLKGFKHFDMGYAAALSFVLLGIVILMTTLFLKLFPGEER